MKLVVDDVINKDVVTKLLDDAWLNAWSNSFL
jgi:hypothetical protein